MNTNIPTHTVEGEDIYQCVCCYILYTASDSKYPILSVFLYISAASPSLKIDPTKFGPSAGNHTRQQALSSFSQ